MKTIWKFVLLAQEIQTVELPSGAKILAAGEQHNKMCMWVEVDPEKEKESRTIQVIGTGSPIQEIEGTTRKYIDSVSLNMGTLIFHVFELIES